MKRESPATPVLAFGVIMLLCPTSHALLRAGLLAANISDASIVKASSGGLSGWKGLVTIVAYVAAIGMAFLSPGLAVLIYIAVAAMWLVPNRRLDQMLK